MTDAELNQKRDELIDHLNRTSHLHSYMNYPPSKAFKDGFDSAVELLLNEIKINETKLAEAYQYLKEGKAKFSPNTTNSFVDDWLKWYEEMKARE